MNDSATTVKNRILANPVSNSRGRSMIGGEPMVFHCNHYNYWLQKTILLVEGLGMEEVVLDAASATAYKMLEQTTAEVGAQGPGGILSHAADTFAEQGFGTIDFGQVTSEGGKVIVPTSHYGQCLSAASSGKFARNQNHFDAGYAAGAAAWAHGLPLGSFRATVQACHSLGASQGVVRLDRQDPPEGLLVSPGAGGGLCNVIPVPCAETNVDEPEILQALSGLDFSGNEEGLLPRFGVMLTNHFANYYNIISFEFVRRMADTGMMDDAEELLVEAAYRCAFNTFGGIMTSPEWDAVIRPQCQNQEDWVHGMLATINALGWGTYRATKVTPDFLQVRIYDDYESCGYLGLFGQASRRVAYLAQGAGAGIMNLVYHGGIENKPELNQAFYTRIFDSADTFHARQTACLASGDDYTEITVER